jgi:hypothetical protein
LNDTVNGSTGDNHRVHNTEYSYYSRSNFGSLCRALQDSKGGHSAVWIH